MQKLDPKAIWLFTLRRAGAILCLVLLSILVFFRTEQLVPAMTPVFILGVLILIILSMLIAWVCGILSYKCYGYEIKEEGFRKESGVIVKKYATIPYEKIQNVDIDRGIFARMLGLSELKIQTAGYSAANSAVAEGILPGLSKKVAEQLRDELISRSISKRKNGAV